MRIICDIDGVLCTNKESNYEHAAPKYGAIEEINRQYESGHIIILWTGRHWDKLELTQLQLQKWGVKHHSLVMAKPYGDIYIDDKSVKSMKEFKSLQEDMRL